MKGKAFIIDLGEKQVKYSQYRERAESVKQKIHFQPLIGVVNGADKLHIGCSFFVGYPLILGAHLQLVPNRVAGGGQLDRTSPCCVDSHGSRQGSDGVLV